jgi:hypothetical protein
MQTNQNEKSQYCRHFGTTESLIYVLADDLSNLGRLKRT